MKRIITTLCLSLGIVGAAHAQFKQGTKYIAASVTGLNMSYSKSSEFNLGLNAEGGYYFADAWMARANIGANHARTLSDFSLGVGVRYSFLQNGIYLGAGLEYAFNRYDTTSPITLQTFNTTTVTRPVLDAEGQVVLDANGRPTFTTEMTKDPVEYITMGTASERLNNIRIPIEIGYTFYLNRFLAIEPAIYSKMSLNHFSEGSEFGLKLGLGFYFKRFHNVSHTHYRPRTYEPVNF